MIHALLLLALAPLTSAAPTSGAAQEPLPRAGPREERSFRSGEQTYRAEVGRVFVAEQRGTPEPPTLELAVARLRSTSAHPGAPIVFLAGGPGEGATRLVDSPIWAAYLELGDVLLIDQRGTGRSRPSLAWSSPALDPARLFGEREDALAAVLEWSALAATEMRAEGVDLAAYTTRASADDVAEVLAVLGHERVRVLAHSYGCHLALELLRRHPQLVERCALLGVAGPDDLLKPAGELAPFLDALARRAAADPAVAAGLPDLSAALGRVLARAAKEPFVVRFPHPESESPVELRIGRFGLQRLVVLDLGDPVDLSVFPRLLHELERGETGLLARFAAKRYAGASQLPLAFYALRGSSGVSRERQARITRDAQTSVFGDARNFPFPDVLTPLGIRALGDEFRRPVRSPVPALLVSGSLDANTPPDQAEAVRATLAQGAHLVVANAGHDDLLLDAQIRARIVAFLAGDEPDPGPLALPPRPFVPLDGAPEATAHPAFAER